MYSLIVTKRDKTKRVKSIVTWAEEYAFDPTKGTLTLYDHRMDPLRIYDLSSAELMRIDIRDASKPQDDVLQTFLGGRIMEV